MQDSTDRSRPLRVCYFGTYRDNYVRNEVLIEGLRRQGVEVRVCHSHLWYGTADRIRQASGGWRWPRFWFRVLRAYWRLLMAYRKVGPYDVMLVGYPGHFDVYLGRLLSWWRRRPMVLDILMSLHLIAEERGLTERSPLTGRLIYWLEKGGLRLPDRLIADTPEYRDYYHEVYGVPLDRFRLIPLGVDDRLFFPRPQHKPPSDCFRVIYYGSFIPLHGVETVVRAAALLRNRLPIRFDLYGEGQELAASRGLAAELDADSVHFCGWLDKHRLPDEIARAHVCLGVFGTTKQSMCTIQNKIWEGMMMQRPVVTGDSPTVRAELVHGRHVILVERANPEALAEALFDLYAQPEQRQEIVTAAYDRVQQNRIDAIGRRLHNVLLELRPDLACAKRRLLITTTTLPRFEGDPEPRFVLDLARGLSNRFDVTILAPNHPQALSEEMLAGVRTFRYRYFPLSSFETLAYPGGILGRLRARPQHWLLVPFLFAGLAVAVRRLLKREHFDCVHCHWLIPQGLIQSLFFSGTRWPPFLVTSHGADVHAINSRFVWWFYRHIVRRASALTAVSETVANKMRNVLGHSDTAGKLSVISMGVDTHHFHVKRRDPNWSPLDRLSRPYTLFVGRLAEKKGVKYLLEAFRSERLRRMAGTLLIVGEGPLRRSLEQHARDIGVSPRVRFLGALTHSDLNKVYASSDVFCAPSIIAEDGDAEGFATVLLEAAASGLPVITTRNTATETFIFDGVNGFLVQERDARSLEEALAKVLHSSQARQRLGTAARESAQSFGWEIIANRYAELIDSAIHARTRVTSP